MSKRKEYNPFPDAPVYNKQIKSGGGGGSSTSAQMGGSLISTKTSRKSKGQGGTLSAETPSGVARLRSGGRY